MVLGIPQLSQDTGDQLVDPFAGPAQDAVEEGQRECLEALQAVEERGPADLLEPAVFGPDADGDLGLLATLFLYKKRKRKRRKKERKKEKKTQRCSGATHLVYFLPDVNEAGLLEESLLLRSDIYRLSETVSIRGIC